MSVDERVGAGSVALGQAAERLELRRDECRLAVQLGLVRTVPGEGRRPRVDRHELERLTGAPDFPEGLRARVRAVGTREAATLLAVTPERFTKLARTGHLNPVRFYLNRYRAVVWLYLAGDVGELARDRPDLLTGPLPPPLRERLAASEDLRPRNWRARRLALLLRSAEDSWERAAAIASLLDPTHLAEVVTDPYERARLDRLRPPPPPGRPTSAAAREITERLTRACDPDEIQWHRDNLADALAEASAAEPAPHTSPPVPTGSLAAPAQASSSGSGSCVPGPSGRAARLSRSQALASALRSGSPSTPASAVRQGADPALAAASAAALVLATARARVAGPPPPPSEETVAALTSTSGATSATGAGAAGGVASRGPASGVAGDRPPVRRDKGRRRLLDRLRRRQPSAGRGDRGWGWPAAWP
ncbi:DUF6397 family protein [Streptomyces sp. NPDC003327]